MAIEKLLSNNNDIVIHGILGKSGYPRVSIKCGAGGVKTAWMGEKG